MADVFSDIYPSRSVPETLVNSARKGGRVRAATANLTLPATIAAGDKGFVLPLPSHCRLLPESTVYWSAGLTGLNDVNFGDANSEDALINGSDWITGGAGNVSAIAAITPDNYGQRLYEMLGYTSDPRSELRLYFTFVPELTGSGWAVADLRYVID